MAPSPLSRASRRRCGGPGRRREKHVHVMGGADIMRQALAAGLVDRLSIIIAPVILGGGKRLFEGFEHDIELEHLGGGSRGSPPSSTTGSSDEAVAAAAVTCPSPAERARGTGRAAYPAPRHGCRDRAWVKPPMPRAGADGCLARRGTGPVIPSVGGMSTHIETLVIGAGQAGLSTAYHLGRGPGLPRHRRPHSRRRRLAPALGLPAALHACPLRRAAGHAVPGGPVALPEQGRDRGLPRGVCRAVPDPGAPGHDGAPGVVRRRALPRRDRRRGLPGRQRRGGHRHLRAGAEHPRLRRGPRRLHHPAPLQRVPPARAARRRAGAGGRRVPLRPRHRVRGGADPADHARRAGPRPEPVRLESPLARVAFPLLWFVWGTVLDRRTPMGRKPCSTSGSTAARPCGQA